MSAGSYGAGLDIKGLSILNIVVSVTHFVAVAFLHPETPRYVGQCLEVRTKYFFWTVVDLPLQVPSRSQRRQAQVRGLDAVAARSRRRHQFRVRGHKQLLSYAET